MLIYEDSDIVITADAHGKRKVWSIKTGKELTKEQRKALEKKWDNQVTGSSEWAEWARIMEAENGR
jgi:hypothetical protein